MTAHARLWAAVPAAGVGVRLGADVPKQYLAVAGKRILEHVLDRFSELPEIDGIVVAIAAGDTHWPALPQVRNPRIRSTTGGKDRCHSVQNCLDALLERASPDDWVLVHDAARPCIRRADIEKLIDAVRDHAVGGILAVPARDTMKRADPQGAIAATVDRTGLWHAQTPQMFRIGALKAALSAAVAGGRTVTDEAQAMELQGLHPLLVQGSPHNIKVTHGDDLAQAGLFLSSGEGRR